MPSRITLPPPNFTSSPLMRFASMLFFVLVGCGLFSLVVNPVELPD
jgi:hypothetical protein